MTMMGFAITRSRRVETGEDRLRALAVLERTYREEKGWVLDVAAMFPASDLERGDIAWFLTRRGGEPVGVLRVLFDPAAATYGQYKLDSVDPNVDVAAFLANNRI